MSATLISNNTTIKISANISASASTTSTATIYTVPANSYADFSARFTATGGAGATFLLIDGVTVNKQSVVIPSGGDAFVNNIKAGPGAVIAVSGNDGTTTSTIQISGVLFTNTP